MFSSGTYLSVEPAEAMRIKYPAHLHSMLKQPGFEPSMAVSRIRHSDVNSNSSSITGNCSNSVSIFFCIVLQIFQSDR